MDRICLGDLAVQYYQLLGSAEFFYYHCIFRHSYCSMGLEKNFPATDSTNFFMVCNITYGSLSFDV